MNKTLGLVPGSNPDISVERFFVRSVTYDCYRHSLGIDQRVPIRAMSNAPIIFCVYWKPPYASKTTVRFFEKYIEFSSLRYHLMVRWQHKSCYFVDIQLCVSKAPGLATIHIEAHWITTREWKYYNGKFFDGHFDLFDVNLPDFFMHWTSYCLRIENIVFIKFRESYFVNFRESYFIVFFICEEYRRRN